MEKRKKYIYIKKHGGANKFRFGHKTICFRRIGKLTGFRQIKKQRKIWKHEEMHIFLVKGEGGERKRFLHKEFEFLLSPHNIGEGRSLIFT